MNEWDKLYPTMVLDNLNAPMRNRATQSMFEPGSTVKPVVGTGAITQGLIGVNKGIECDGFLQIRGRTFKSAYRCWTASIGDGRVVYAHHSVPIPHQGHDGNADGWLTFSDALERSCNVYFETLADSLQIEGLTYWMKQYGLGRPTGIGIAEVRGRVPDSFLGLAGRQQATFNAGIGQGPVGATPLQMCNVAATIARRGIWMRPNLVNAGYDISPYRPKGFSSEDATWDVPSRMDLHIAPEAIDAAINGMENAW